MRWFVHAFALGATLLAVDPAVSLTGQAPDPILGTWKLNLAKSKYRPGPPPKSVTVTFEAAGAGIKATANGMDSEGKPFNTSYTAGLDGKDYPVSGSADYDAVSIKRIDASTRQTTRKRGGKVVQTMRTVISKDGKHYTSTTKGTNSKGQHMNNVAVFEKQ